ncbi:MAG: DUF2254 domain-containing protein [Gemmatimonadota bacterium]|nr:DUF2254 domain-containing protein [Gemmatimonadota bacterium]
MEKLRAIWDDLQSSLWFVPTAVSLSSVVVARVAIEIDHWIIAEQPEGWTWIYGGGADSARVLLGTIAGSMVTIASVTFSITMVALTLASGQFTPRILRNFMRDRINQIVLASFIATFLFSVLILREIRAGEEAYVPAFSVTLAVVGVLISFGLFIFFIHHVATAIQASSIIQSAANDTRRQIAATFERDTVAIGPAWMMATPPPRSSGRSVRSNRDGYVERIDIGRLRNAAIERDATLHVLVGPGDFAIRDEPIAVWQDEAEQPDEDDGDVLGAFLMGRQRTISEDFAFGFRQIVDIAVRALSPGVNDPTTACNAVDHLASLLADLADREWPRSEVEDDDGDVRVVLLSAGFEEYVALAFSEIRRYGRGDLAVTLRLLEAIARIADSTSRPDRIDALRTEALGVVYGASRAIEDPIDRQRIERRLERIAEVFEDDPEEWTLDGERVIHPTAEAEASD